MALPESNVVTVSMNLKPIGPRTQNVNSMVVLTSSDLIDPVTRVLQAPDQTASLSALGDVPATRASGVWFAQKPTPSGIVFGRVVKTASHGQVFGAALSASEQVMDVWTALTAGAFYVNIGGKPIAITGVNLSACVTLNGVAAAIQTALQVKSAGATVLWDAANSRFYVTAAATGVASVVSFFEAPTAVGSILFAVNAADGDTVTLNGQLLTFVAAAPGADEVLIGATLAETLQNLESFLGASEDADLIAGTYFVDGTHLYVKAAAPGVGGNAYSLAASVATPSGATLAGGVDAAGHDLSAPMGMRQDDGGFASPGLAPETPVQALTTLINRWGGLFYGVTYPEGSVADQLALAQFVESTRKILGVSTQDPASLLLNDTTSVGYLLNQAGYTRTCVQFSSTEPYSVASYLGRMLTTNWNAQNSIITMMFKDEPGVAGENLTPNQNLALKQKRINVMADYDGGEAFVQYGTMSGALYTDTRVFLDWLEGAIQSSVVRLFRNSNVVQQTPGGVNRVTTAINQGCDLGVLNAGIQPGTWNLDTVGPVYTGKYLTRGYEAFAAPLSSQDEADRENRIGPVQTVCIKLGGAIHKQDIIVNVNQ